MSKVIQMNEKELVKFQPEKDLRIYLGLMQDKFDSHLFELRPDSYRVAFILFIQPYYQFLH